MSAPLKNVYYEMLKKKSCLEQEQALYKERAFLLCKSCFWCASIFYDDVGPFRTRLTCKNYELEFMHLSTGETYKFDYDKRHGFTLEFIQRDRTSERPFYNSEQLVVGSL
jgi:hypothetical protein